MFGLLLHFKVSHCMYNVQQNLTYGIVALFWVKFSVIHIFWMIPLGWFSSLWEHKTRQNNASLSSEKFTQLDHELWDQGDGVVFKSYKVSLLLWRLSLVRQMKWMHVDLRYCCINWGLNLPPGENYSETCANDHLAKKTIWAMRPPTFSPLGLDFRLKLPCVIRPPA